MKIGDTITWQRTFAEEDIRRFNEVSGDQGVHHVTADEHGRLMVHGLLTATIPTKIGGDMNFIAREMKFQFYRPVFSGDTLVLATDKGLVVATAVRHTDNRTNAIKK